jgi:hypothetical protein
MPGESLLLQFLLFYEELLVGSRDSENLAKMQAIAQFDTTLMSVQRCRRKVSTNQIGARKTN